jgi:MYXO-CTERM domain-containing protein
MTCSPTCKTLTIPDTGGCCSAHGNPAGPLLLAGLVGGFVLRRRRRAILGA